MIMSMATSAFAKSNNQFIEGDEGLTILDGSIVPLYDVSCPGGKHNMKSNGVGRAMDSSGKTIFNGACYQCSNCYLVLCSESDPQRTHTLGRYCFYMAYEPIGTAGCVVRGAQIESFYGDVRTDSFWQGFIFTKGV